MEERRTEEVHNNRHIMRTHPHFAGSDEKLIPNPVTPLGRSVVEVNQLICSVRTFVLTFGAAFHPQHTKDSTLSAEESKGRRGELPLISILMTHDSAGVPFSNPKAFQG